MLIQCPRWSQTSLVVQGFLVEHVLAETRPHTLQVGDIVRQLLDGLHLFFQVVFLQKVTQMGVIMASADLVKVKQRLVHVLLKSQRSLHGLQTAAPLISLWFLDVLEHDAAATLVLVRHQLLSVFAFLFRLVLEELEEAFQSDVITIEVPSHGMVHVAGVQLQVDLLVDAGFNIAMIVLAWLSLCHDFRFHLK